MKLIAKRGRKGPGAGGRAGGSGKLPTRKMFPLKQSSKNLCVETPHTRKKALVFHSFHQNLALVLLFIAIVIVIIVIRKQ